jgi:DNA-binding NarL/FixJ family response regulator
LLSDFSAKSETIHSNEKKHDSRRQDILRLSGEGRGIEEIAQKLSITRGEVKLILNMSRGISERPENRIETRTGEDKGTK